MKHQNIIMGGLLAAVLLITIGAAFTSAQLSVTTAVDTNTGQHSMVTPPPAWRNTSDANATDPGSLRMGSGYDWVPPGVNLTEAQQAELNTTIAQLLAQNASHDSIRNAVQALLDSYGVYDAQLQTDINQTSRQLAILNRQKDLRTQGYNWSAIRTIIADEFGEDAAMGVNTMAPQHGMMSTPQGFGPGLNREPQMNGNETQ